jgi:uncharacterized membrane protein YfcA
VAGGELIIPTLVFAFGAGIKAAGTASLLISLPTVAVGVLRHRRLGSFEERADLTRTVAPMGLGSVAGAVACWSAWSRPQRSSSRWGYPYCLGGQDLPRALTRKIIEPPEYEVRRTTLPRTRCIGLAALRFSA